MEEIKALVKRTDQTTNYIVGSNLLDKLDDIISASPKKYSSFLVLSDENIFKLYGGKVLASLQKLHRPITQAIIPVGEKYKSLQEVENLIKVYFKNGFSKTSCLIALGGGVITDMGGFIASILLRGIDIIYLPTTLLSQVDAAIGGKTGVDFQINSTMLLKNMIGTIRQPNMVISDINTLSTLPEVEVLNGLGEMAKYWIGWGKPDVDELKFVKSSLASTPGVEREKLINVILLCQKIKIGIIQKDPEEKLGLRQKLNLGHTIGHAVEATANGRLSHGQAVSIGLVATAKLSLYKGLLSKDTCEKIISQLKILGLPFSFKADKKEILKALSFDKKEGTFVLIKDIGNIVSGVKVDMELIEKVIAEVIL